MYWITIEHTVKEGNCNRKHTIHGWRKLEELGKCFWAVPRYDRELILEGQWRERTWSHAEIINRFHLLIPHGLFIVGCGCRYPKLLGMRRNKHSVDTDSWQVLNPWYRSLKLEQKRIAQWHRLLVESLSTDTGYRGHRLVTVVDVPYSDSYVEVPSRGIFSRRFFA